MTLLKQHGETNMNMSKVEALIAATTFIDIPDLSEPLRVEGIVKGELLRLEGGTSESGIPSVS